MHKVISDFSSALGGDSLLVQGAGGNISWKDGDTLWIKSSGTWLADARLRDIFVPLSLATVQTLMRAGEESFTSAIVGDSAARPSIETSLHALLPHRVVVHVHPVDVLAICARKSSADLLAERLDGLSWVLVPYAKPGVRLTAAVSAVCKQYPAANALVLANHGLVVGGDTVNEVDDLLRDISMRLRLQPRTQMGCDLTCDLSSEMWQQYGYFPTHVSQWHVMAQDRTVLELARDHWVMYPDHAVFLGANATIVHPCISHEELERAITHRPPCLFVDGVGVLERPDMTKAQRAMLQCFYDVVMRIDDASDIQSLSDADVSELLNWDAEKYRQRHSQ
ncbi:class II aldolase/adducin family protein [Burkholderia multivorans]|uniref:class II aldolase/adducin family protein n=1 Tax=Burkholderia multivorans TaxID=87883 RepID=UPI000D3A0E93|nr:class II aldolase/adducin family protein [Burkholderia multivorans]MEB2513701.1 class II aldolase/adducin family protein [Burkholderia multivorans]MEB2524398.1 class II aldolase/adducin family protein [Burkholderia multivorans]MEB2576741.1 class II aldolase/adducin family protein [Burkholderia multivorans]MEB2594032.1 class II aldolase/adducin family protein [Burkholderia multivorans]PTO45712.1 class II aldolase [Burkholderia multivorans]